MNNDNNASRTECPTEILGMDPDTMRELGYRVVDLVIQRLQNRDSEVALRNRSLELTRNTHAIKLWMSSRSYGVPAFRDAIQRGIALAEVAERWDVVTPTQIGVIVLSLKVVIEASMNTVLG